MNDPLAWIDEVIGRAGSRDCGGRSVFREGAIRAFSKSTAGDW